MSSNGVTITERENGDLWVEGPDFGNFIKPPAVAALRAYFAAERMPEDVQALLAKAQKFVELRGFTQATNLVDELALALEAVYSQKVEPEWEYKLPGHDDVLGALDRLTIRGSDAAR